MIHVKIFTGGKYLPSSEYKYFIEENPQIKIISVNTTTLDWVILTYED